MSASPHYQSRLFNFLTDRALRWGDRAAQALRHAQIAAKTVARSVLLPIWVIAENLGISPPKLPGFSSSVRDRSFFAPGVEDEPNQDYAHGLAADAPIRATLTLLEAAGWPTVDRLEREALQPATSDPPSPLHWLRDRFKRKPLHPQHTNTTAPEPLTIQLSPRELHAIAPHPQQTHPSPIRGLASELGRSDLVLVAANNEIVAYLGTLPQQTLDHTVRIVLNQLAPASLTAARSGVVALPPMISQFVHPLVTRLDAGLASLEARSQPPSGFAIAQSFDLHHSFAEAALETAIETPLDQLQTLPASNLQALELSFSTSLQFVTRSLRPRAIGESGEDSQNYQNSQTSHPTQPHRLNLGHNPALRASLRALNAWATAERDSTEVTATDDDRASRTTIDGSQWLIDPADPWWRNAIDLARAAIASTVSAIVPTQPATSLEADLPPDFSRSLGLGDQPLHSKTANRWRDWFTDRDDSSPNSTNNTPSPIVSTAPAAPTDHTSPETDILNPIVATTPAKAAPRSPSPHTASGLDFDPDWIEAKVQQSHYVMHPLERVLRWLDRVMAAIEAWIDTVIEAIGQWWSRRQAS
ncbi:MAG: hypothetical protein EAZ61_06795 [Oscillatoriales cyanobacterium]|nr:MAG: hypothetical protein EAZ61_06795 [Oscillatoriales cyanobacterium]